MLRTVTVGLGILTFLIVLGVFAHPGRALLGHRAAKDDNPVTPIQDTLALAHVAGGSGAPPAVHAAPAGSASRSRTAPGPSGPASSHAAARSKPAPAARRPASAQGAPPSKAPTAQLSVEQIEKIANILLNLPEVLSQTHASPAH